MGTRKDVSTDIYVKREHWSTGYQMVARSNGKFVTNEKWHGALSTERVLNKVRAGNIVEDKEDANFVYHFRGNTMFNEPRTLAVFGKRRILIGSKKKRRLDIVHLKQKTIEKYRPTTFCHAIMELEKITYRDTYTKHEYKFIKL